MKHIRWLEDRHARVIEATARYMQAMQDTPEDFERHLASFNDDLIRVERKWHAEFANKEANSFFDKENMKKVSFVETIITIHRKYVLGKDYDGKFRKPPVTTDRPVVKSQEKAMNIASLLKDILSKQPRL